MSATLPLIEGFGQRHWYALDLTEDEVKHTGLQMVPKTCFIYPPSLSENFEVGIYVWIVKDGGRSRRLLSVTSASGVVVLRHGNELVTSLLSKAVATATDAFLSRVVLNSLSPHHKFIIAPLTMALPNMTPEDYVARMDEFQYEVYRLSKAVRDDSASIHGAAISNTSLLLIKYVEPERLRLLWQPPPYPPDIEQAFPDFSEYINDYLEDFDDLPTEGIPPPWIAHRRSCDVYHALAGIIHETLLHNPESDLDRPIPYTAFECVAPSTGLCHTMLNTSLSGVPLDASYMYWCCRSVYFTPNTPNMTVISIHPQQGPPNQLTLTELWTLLYFGLRFSRRVKNMSYMAVSRLSRQ